MSISNLKINENTYSDLKVKSVSCDQIICNSHNSDSEMIIPVIPNGDPLPTPENGSIISYNDGTGYEFWYCDDVAWHKVSGIAGTGDVQGPAGASDSNLALYDGVTGKVIKSSNVKLTGTRFQGFDALNNPAPIEFNGDISLLGFDVLNIGAIGADTVNTDLIASKTGSVVVFNDKPQSSTAPTVNDDLTNKLYVDTAISGISGGDVVGPASAVDNRLTTFDGVSGKLIQDGTTITATGNTLTGLAGGVIFATNTPQTSVAPTVDDDLTNKLYVENRLGYFYSTLADGPTVAQGDGEVSLLPTGVGTSVGTLTVPGGGFSIGDTFHFVVAGDCIFDTNQEIVLRLKNGGTLASIQMNLENTDSPNSFWELEADFTIRSLGTGGSGNGEVVTNFDFTFNKRIDKDFKGQRNVTVSNLNTTVSNTLDITAEFLTGDTSSINCRLAYLKKMH
jgi:hypothetical protein